MAPPPCSADGARAPITDEQWHGWLEVLGIPQAELVDERSFRPDQRIYVHDGLLYKIFICREPDDPRQARRVREFRNGYKMTRRCRGISAIPPVVRRERRGPMELVVYRAVQARRVSMRALSIPQVVVVLTRLAWTLAQMSARRMTHNDLHTSNILRGPDGRCYLIDLDDAVVHTSIVTAVWHNFVRGRPDRKRRYGTSFLRLVRAIAGNRLRRRWTG